MSHYYFQGKEQASLGSNLIPLPMMRESNPNYDILYNIPVLKNKVFQSPVLVRKYNTNALIPETCAVLICTPLCCCNISTDIQTRTSLIKLILFSKELHSDNC